jgi:hypothetical protein
VTSAHLRSPDYSLPNPPTLVSRATGWFMIAVASVQGRVLPRGAFPR